MESPRMRHCCLWLRKLHTFTTFYEINYENGIKKLFLHLNMLEPVYIGYIYTKTDTITNYKIHKN